MSIFQKIGHFFVGLFNAAKKAYENLSVEQQTALQNGSGIVDLINTMLDKTPEEIRAVIQAKYPNIDEKALESGLFQVANTFGLQGVANLDEAIAAIQKHLSSLDGKVWAVASHAAASALAIIFAPVETKVSAIVSLIEWVYQTFIKKAA
jgi:hypothetical protein